MNTIGFAVGEAGNMRREESMIPQVDFQHVLCQGMTGSGKTASLILPILRDRIERGHCILFFDHKGHEHKKVKYLAKRAGRLEDVVEIGKPHAGYINLMAELDIIRLKELIREDSTGQDPYWANSAANLLGDIVSILRGLHDVVMTLERYGYTRLKGKFLFRELEQYGIDIYDTPSFQTVSKVIASANSFRDFRKIAKRVTQSIERGVLLGEITSIFKDHFQKRSIFAKLLSLKKEIQKSERFSLNEEGGNESGGNNGVLQYLDNTVATYASRDYINKDEYTMTGLMGSRAILVIDTQSFSDDVMKVFLESLLKKTVMRLRTDSTTPTSVFIDEANRVLSPAIDLHNDVLREARVELVIAVQNEEQMISKFTQTVWDSILHNIRHRYSIDVAHRIRYNESTREHYAQPLLISESEQRESEQCYYRHEKNRKKLQTHFLGDEGRLPESFVVIYDLELFAQSSSVYVEGSSGERGCYTYHGEEVVSRVTEKYPPQLPRTKRKPFTLDIKSDDLELDEALFLFGAPDNAYERGIY